MHSLKKYITLEALKAVKFGFKPPRLDKLHTNCAAGENSIGYNHFVELFKSCECFLMCSLISSNLFRSRS